MQSPISPPPPPARRYFRLDEYFRQVLSGPGRKVLLDAGLLCPNRDGTLSGSGCLFCNGRGSGTGLFARGLGLSAQWELQSARVRARHPEARLLAYLQSFSNTHCAPRALRSMLAEIYALPGVAGLCLGTRPDCLDLDADRARLDILAEFLGSGEGRLPFMQLDLGLQSADPAVLSRIGRGHGPEVFALAVREASARGIAVCAHLMHGLPQAAPDDLLRSVAFVNALPVASVKFHNTLVCRGTGLAALWSGGGYQPPGQEAYVAALAQALAALRPDICVQRLAADPAPGELLAPDWGQDKAGTLTRLFAELGRLGLRQGSRLG